MMTRMGEPADRSRLGPAVPGRAGVVAWEQLRGWAVRVLRLAGASEDAADATADACLYASRRGLDSHGIVYLATYLPRLRDGVIDGAARPAVVGGTDALAVIDGRSAAGAFVARFAMDWCCDRAARHGIAAAVVRNSNHFGAASCYADRAATRGCVGLVLSNSDAAMAPEGSLAPAVGTNPLAVAAPGTPMPSLDMSTSVVAHGRIAAAARAGELLPAAWGIGPDGQPTRDPAEVLANAVLPMGGHKGFALAFMLEVLTGCLAGGSVGPDLHQERGVCHLFVAIDVDRAGGRPAYEGALARLVGSLHDVPRAEGAESLRYPGEGAARTGERRRGGLELDESTAATLRQIGEEWGAPFPPERRPGAEPGVHSQT